MKIVFILILSLLILAACHFVEINMVQRTILDNGDETKDSVKSSIDKPEREEYELIAPIK